MLVDINFNPDELVFDPEKHKYFYDDIPDHLKSLHMGDILVRLDKGIYEYWDVNEPMLDGYEFENYYDNYLPNGREYTDTYGYGVCDNYQQVLERDEDVKKFIDDPDKKFILKLCYIAKKDQPADGGWRWHKWGEYIGDLDPQYEYLYDEDDDIEGVFVYQLLEVVEVPEKDTEDDDK